MTTLRKSDISARVSAKLGVPRAEGEAALNAVLESIQDALQEGDKVVLTRFGSFDVRSVKARKVRAIRGSNAGELTEIPAHKRVGFRPGSELNKIVNGGE